MSDVYRDSLEACETLARELDEGETAAEVAALRERLEEGRFFVACVGQFKRGKSTLLNALMGMPVLPVGVVPVTAVVTVLRYGPEPRLRIRTDRWRDARLEEIVAYVTEEQNPENVKGVTGAEVYVPSALLASGMCLVDTPGLGSVFAGNTAATRAFVPQIDAALVVLGADPPISGEELTLLEQVAVHVDCVLVAINKADRLSAEDVTRARTFTETVIAKRLGREVGEVLAVSAIERLGGLKSRDWSLLETRLETWGREIGGSLVEAARRRGLERFRKHLVRAVDTHREALVRPLDESSQKLEALTRAVEGAERALLEVQPLFRAEEVRLEGVLRRWREVFLERAFGRAAAALSERLSAEKSSPQLRTRAFEIAQSIAREQIDQWAREVRPEIDELYRQATARFVVLGNEFLRRVRTGDGDAFAELPAELDPDSGLRARSSFYFTELLPLASPAPASAILFALLSPSQAARVAYGHAARYLVRLLETNSARITNDLIDRIRESGSQLRGEIAGMLRTLVATACRALERARGTQERGEAAVRAELSRLEVIRSGLRRLDARTADDGARPGSSPRT